MNAANNTGDGQVVITYEPSTDSCPVATPIVAEPKTTG